MAKEFYTEKDIEDLFRRGMTSLVVNDNVVLTELAYEKANRLGMQLVREKPDNPPGAPVRPYIAQPQPGAGTPAGAPAASTDGDLHARIREAVLARLGGQVDATLVDTIIARVLKQTGVQ
ncbi:MAG: hypothetical protein HPY76_13375 [Anaerolineae bacterium]|nr:hypothetical protein [Anaerolineae bacterium]